MAILRCRISKNIVGILQWTGLQIEDGKKPSVPVNDDVSVFNLFPNGAKIDMRSKAPFLEILPCPYCGCESPREHDLSKHIDAKLGAPTEDVETLAKSKGISFSQAAALLLLERIA